MTLVKVKGSQIPTKPTAANDSDLIIVISGGVTYKMSRAAFLEGIAGGSQDLASVLAQGNEADGSIVLQDATDTTTISKGLIELKLDELGSVTKTTINSVGEITHVKEVSGTTTMVNFEEPTGNGTVTIPDVVDEAETIATREWVNDNVSGGSSLIREEFVFSASQTFTLANNYAQVYSVEVQGQGALSTSQYSLVSPNQVTINDTLDSGDYIVIIYSTAVAGVQSYYTQAETDALVNTKISKNIAATYTTNAVTTVTQAEYDALTPDPTTIYFIV